jgi:hypothetical protein
MYLKLKDFLSMFAWMLATQVIGMDLKILTPSPGFYKYIVPIAVGITNALYLAPLSRKRKAELEKNKTPAR